MEATSGVLENVVSLPDGGGSISGLGEQFQPNLLKGTGNYSIPIEIPDNPAGPTPELSLDYSTGLGDGPFGLGWTLSGPLEIRRRTSDGVPTYDGDDAFAIGDAGELVEVGDGRFRPAADRDHRDVRRAGGGWRVRTKEGEEYTLGTTDDSRVTDGERVFAWLVDEHRDPAGNVVSYEYERHRNAVYLSRIEWGPYSLQLTYESRPDPVRFGRAGFPVTTARRCSRVEEHCETLEDTLVSRYDLRYEQAEGSERSLLVEVGQTAFDGDDSESRPSVSMEYERPDPADAALVRVESDDGLPDLSQPASTLVDLNGDGLPDALRTGPGGHVRWPNEGRGTFGVRESMPTDAPALTVGEDGVSFGDVDGDGAVDLFQIRGGIGTTVLNTGAGAWADRPTVYAQQVPLGLRSASSRLVDLDGDGAVDLLQSGPDGFLLCVNDDGEGWERPFSVPRRQAGATLPDLGPNAASVEVADLTGDGLSDLVFVEDGRVEYWPHYGHGNWGERVRMTNPPSFPAHFDRERLFLTDVDRDGTADLVYVGVDSVSCWLNRSGEGFSDRYEVPYVPPADPDAVLPVDLTGRGVTGLVWSGAEAIDRRDTGYRYLELGGDQTPYLLTSVDSGFGLKTEIQYTTTTEQRLADREADEAWDTFLPFPLHVVDAYVETDRTTGRTRRTELAYHRGTYDGAAGRFRGFERVELTVIGDDHTPTVTQETVFEQPTIDGTADVEADRPAGDDRLAGELARERALSGLPAELRTFEVAADGTRTLHESATVTWDARREYADGEAFVHFPHVSRLEARRHAPGERDRIEATEYDYDQYGNVTRRVARSRFEDEPPSEALVTEQQLTYTDNESAWLVGLPASVAVRDGDGNLRRHVRRFYDGPAFEGLPNGAADAGVLRRVQELALADWALPDGYADEIEASWGLDHEGEGYYRDTESYRHDDAGTRVAIRDQLGTERTIEYDDAGFPTTVTRTDGGDAPRTAHVEFDHRTAQPSAVDFPDGTVVRYRYAPLGRVLAIEETTADGSIAPTKLFDADFGDESDLTSRPPNVTSIEPRTNETSTADLLDSDPASLDGVDVAREYFDGEGNRLQEVRTGPDAEDGTRRWVAARRRRYTVRGDAAEEYPDAFVDSLAYRPDLPTDDVTSYSYTVDGATARIEYADGSRFRVDHFPDRREKRESGVADDDPPIVERVDARDELVAVEEPAGAGDVARTGYDVDLEGRITAITDASGRVAASYTYAGPGDPIRIDHADAGRRTYWRDARSNLRLRTDSLGRRIERSYDAAGRKTAAIDASDPQRPETVREFEYENGRLVATRDGDVRVSFGHDAVGRRTERTVEYADGATLTLEREYTRQGNTAALVAPDGTRLEYERDDTGARTAVSGFVDDVSHDVDGNPTAVEFPSGARTEYEHDRLGRLERAALRDPDGGTLRALDYDYDERGNVTELRDTFPDEVTTRRFEYDPRYRLTAARYYDGEPTGTARRSDEYEYSSTGDLRRNEESFAGRLQYGDADHEGRLTAVRRPRADSPTRLSYDAGGKVTGYGALEDLTYDSFGRLVEVEKTDGTTVRFSYDASGRRVETVVTSDGDARRTRFAGDQYQTGPDEDRLRVALGDVAVAVRVTEGGSTRTASLLTDHLGSVVAAADGSGGLVGQQVYTPYGRPLRSTSSEALSRYIGAEPDAEVGLAKFGDRYYAAELGRFISPDWFVIENPGQTARYPAALNAYSYSVNNPLRFRDPSGRLALLTVGIALAIGFAVGFAAGTVAGLATGKSVGESLLRGLEAGLLGAAGLALGFATGVVPGMLVGAAFSAQASVIVGGLVGGVVGGTVGFLNGVVSGANRIYSLDPIGLTSFVVDSTWGLLGTTMGLFIHGWNAMTGANYDVGRSERKNRHVYTDGASFGPDFALTWGNVVSNLEGPDGTPPTRHEMAHVNQSRLFGPIWQGTYLAWGLIAGSIGLLTSGGTEQSPGQDVRDMAYRNNPFELWAVGTQPGTAGGGAKSWQV